MRSNGFIAPHNPNIKIISQQKKKEKKMSFDKKSVMNLNRN